MESRSYIPVNYLYFGAFILLLSLMSTGSVFIKENTIESRFFFLLYAFGQIILETCGLIFVGFLLRSYTKPVYFWIFIGCTFILAILHMLDFLMDRILDLSVWDTCSFVFDETLDDFLYLLDASGIPLWAWLMMFIAFLALPLLGIFFYKITDTLSNKQPLVLRIDLFLLTLVCIPAALLLWDVSASKIIHPDTYRAFVKSLPWRFTFIQPRNVLVPIKAPLLSPLDESSTQIALSQQEVTLSKRPNIYLFIVESLRGDFITEETAPHLTEFAKSAIVHDMSVSNANGTNLSWFSIFHSQFSLFWNEYKKNQWSIGSPALQLLKQGGYKTRVYTSAQLSYYGLDKLIFGKNLQLIDSFYPVYHQPPIQAWQSDEEIIHKAIDDLSTDPALHEGQLFIFFLDSTHFDYSWPKERTSRFAPFASNIAYFKTYQTSKNIELIKNSYRNAVHHVDSLFGAFWQKMPRRDEAIVAFMGDHAEEFFEHGHLFHNSHLIDEQIRIPFYLKFGSNAPLVHKKPVISQIDFFPTLLDYLSGQTFSFLQGESIFRESKWPYAMICRFNGGRTPYEFSFHNGCNKVILQFQKKNHIVKSEALKILSLWNCKNQNISECKVSIEKWLGQEFQGAFQRLFPSLEYQGVAGDQQSPPAPLSYQQ